MAFNLSRGNATPAASTTIENRPVATAHLVRPGETLDSIASRYGISRGDLIARNNHHLGSDGAAFAPGLRLAL